MSKSLQEYKHVNKVSLQDPVKTITPYRYTLSTGLPIVILCHVDVIRNGHPVLVCQYDLFHEKNGCHKYADKNISGLDKWTDPDYLGELVVELPGRLFTYHHGDCHELRAEEIPEIITYVMEQRSADGNKWNESQIN